VITSIPIIALLSIKLSISAILERLSDCILIVFLLSILLISLFMLLDIVGREAAFNEVLQVVNRQLYIVFLLCLLLSRMTLIRLSILIIIIGDQMR
jgi:hypothetical protein